MSEIPVELRAILLGEDACAEAVFLAAVHILGERFIAWEPETIRLEMEDLGVRMREENFEALMACVALKESTDFFWDANAFENICVALNGEIPDVDGEDVLSPAQIAWAVEQAVRIARSSFGAEIPDDLSTDDMFDYEPVNYTADTCLNAGMVCAPDELAFCGEQLKRYTCAEEDLCLDVKKSWEKVDQEKLEEHPFGEDAVGVQLALKATVVVYLRMQRARLLQQVNMLREAINPSR